MVFKFYIQDFFGYNYRHLPIYTNIDGEIWGDPLSDAYLLSIPETELPTPFYIQNSTLFLEGIKGFDNKDLRMYDINGKLTKAFNSIEIANGIDISELNSGVYFVIYNQGSKTKRFKFVKE